MPSSSFVIRRVRSVCVATPSYISEALRLISNVPSALVMREQSQVQLQSGQDEKKN